MRKPDAAGAAGNCDGFGLQQSLFEALDGAHVGLRRPGSHRYAEAYARKIDVRAEGNPLFAAISSLSPSLERITTSAPTPRPSCAAIVCGPDPCDAPDPVLTFMPSGEER